MLLGAGGWSGHGHQDRVGEGHLSGREFAGQVLSCREVSVAVGMGVIPAWGQCVQRPCGMRGVFEEVGDCCGSAGKRRECKRGAGARGFALCEATYSGAWGLPPGMWVPPHPLLPAWPGVWDVPGTGQTQVSTWSGPLSVHREILYTKWDRPLGARHGVLSSVFLTPRD